MLDNERVRYFLLHLTKHSAGRDLMKKCMWDVCPQGGFYASKTDNPKQALLIEPEPDLTLLQQWVSERLSAGPKRWSVLTEEVRGELWLGKHLNGVIRSMWVNGEIVADDYSGKFAQSKNPRLTLALRRTRNLFE